MFAFLQNQWIVGIGGGIISGIIVYFITNHIYRKKDNSKYIEQINNANTDIIRALKPYVAERGLPEKEVIDAMIVSVARKYKVKSDELYSVRIICEELIREVVENIYVSSEKKYEFTKQLSEYLHTLDVEKRKSYLVTDIEKEIRNMNAITELNYRQRIITFSSIMISIFTALLTMIGIYTSAETMAGDIGDIDEIMVVLIGIVVCVVTLSTSFIDKYIGGKSKKKKYSIRDDKDN